MTDYEAAVAEFILAQEYAVWEWGTNPPTMCTDDDAPAAELMSDIQYHFGCYYEAVNALETAYQTFGIDKKAPDDMPWWMEESIGEFNRRREAELAQGDE